MAHFLMLLFVTYLDIDINKLFWYANICIKKSHIAFFCLIRNLVLKVILTVIFKCALMTFANLKNITIETVSSNKEKKVSILKYWEQTLPGKNNTLRLVFQEYLQDR